MNAPLLWMKIPDEVLFAARFDAEGRRALESVFAASAGSPWNEALALLGMEIKADVAPVIRWHRNAPYFNWNVMAAVTSGGILTPVKHEDGSYRFSTRYSLSNLWRLMFIQWKTTRFLGNLDQLPQTIAVSIALGLSLQTLLMRLGRDVDQLDRWLSHPREAPARYRKIVAQIQDIQLRRTAMSPVWQSVLSGRGEGPNPSELPEFFWDDQPPAPATAPSTQSTANKVARSGWKGRPVCAGQCSGLAVTAPVTPEIVAALRQKHNAPIILVFRHARPEAVELFPYADALIFCTGGTLSHACTVARAMGIPGVTAAGEAFWDFSRREGPVWIKLDGAAGTLCLIE